MNLRQERDLMNYFYSEKYYNAGFSSIISDLNMIKNKSSMLFSVALNVLLYFRSINLNRYILKKINVNQEELKKQLNYITSKGLSSDKFLLVLESIKELTEKELYFLVLDLNETERFKDIENLLKKDFKLNINEKNMAFYLIEQIIIIQSKTTLNLSIIFEKNEELKFLLFKENVFFGEAGKEEVDNFRKLFNLNKNIKNIKNF